MIQKPEGIRQDEFWSTIEWAAILVIALSTGFGMFLAMPLATLPAIGVSSIAAGLTWAVGGHFGLRTSLILGVGLFVVAILWGWWARPPLLYVDALGDFIWPNDQSAASATGTELKWKQSYVYPTPTHRIRDWSDPKLCTARGRFACGVLTWDTTFESDEGWRIILKHDGTLTWPESVTDEEAARFFCDLPADEWEDYNRTWPYFVALRAARPSLSPALEAECGL